MVVLSSLAVFGCFSTVTFPFFLQKLLYTLLSYTILMGRDFKKLKIFDLSYRFVIEIYGILPSFPDSELRNMYSQLQRAATSIVLNIVEGASNRSNKVFFNHLQYSYGSCREVEVLLMLSRDLHFIETAVFESLSFLLEELKASLYRFMFSVDREIRYNKHNWEFKKN